MSKKISVAFPFIQGRYIFTVPFGFDNRIDYKLWGGGGAASNYGGSGAGGNFLSGTTTVSEGSTVELYIGAGGSGRTGGGGYLANNSKFSGGIGGYGGDSDNDMGHGGGGGGATALIINGVISAVAGGGGGAGGAGDDESTSAGQSATGEIAYTTLPLKYKHSVTDSAWCNLLNTYGVWEGSGDYYWDIYFPDTGVYDITLSVDNLGTIYFDDSEIFTITNEFSYATEFQASVTVYNTGIHTIKFSATNTGGPGGLAWLLKRVANGQIIGTSRSDKRNASSGVGINGTDGYDDGPGGGGGGGAGYPYGGNAGGYSACGFNGANYDLNTSNHGNPASYYNPGGIDDADYVTGVSTGGRNGGNGGNGYVVISFYRSDDLYIKHESVYKQMTPYIKLNGVYKKVDAWVKVGGNWSPAYSNSTVEYTTDSENWA